MALFAKLKEIFSNKVESLEDSMALANPLDIQVFEGLMGESKALSYCLTTLCLDKELDINDLVSQLHPSTIEIAKKLYFEGFKSAQPRCVMNGYFSILMLYSLNKRSVMALMSRHKKKTLLMHL